MTLFAAAFAKPMKIRVRLFLFDKPIKCFAFLLRSVFTFIFQGQTKVALKELISRVVVWRSTTKKCTKMCATPARATRLYFHFKPIIRFHMSSQPSCRCSQTKKRRPCSCADLIHRELHSLIEQTFTLDKPGDLCFDDQADCSNKRFLRRRGVGGLGWVLGGRKRFRAPFLNNKEFEK